MVGNLEVGLIEAEIPTGETVVAKAYPSHNLCRNMGQRGV